MWSRMCGSWHMASAQTRMALWCWSALTWRIAAARRQQRAMTAAVQVCAGVDRMLRSSQHVISIR